MVATKEKPTDIPIAESLLDSMAFLPLRISPGASAELSADVVLMVGSDPRYLSLIRRVTEDVASRLGMSVADTDAIKLAVGEACANAMEHGSPCGKSDHISVIFSTKEGRLCVEIMDTGPTACIPKNGRRRGLRLRGYGIQLMRALMDSVEFECEKCGTRVILTKCVPVNNIPNTDLMIVQDIRPGRKHTGT